MFTKFDKAWVTAAVAFGALSASTFLGLDIDPTVQAGIVSVILFAVTYLVPNKT